MNKPRLSAPDLAADYYLTNFRFLVSWVLLRYEDLLSSQERQFVSRFQELPHNSQSLLVRLFSRKGPLFRQDKLHYPEIDSIAHATEKLIAVGLLSSDELISMHEAANLLTKAELLSLFGKHLNGAKQARKDVLVAHLSNIFPQPKAWRDWTNHQLGEIYHLDSQPIISNLLLLFFGNAYQDLTEFVLQDLGLYRYENYVVDPQHRIFKNREELEQYQQLIQLREHLDHATDVSHLVQIANNLPAELPGNALTRRRARLCNQLAYELERMNEHHFALQLYRQSYLPPARERCVRLLEKQGELTAAWVLLNEILKTPCNEHELQVAQRMAPRLAKKVGEPVARKISTSVTEQQVILAKNKNVQGNFFNVEEAVRQFVHTPESPCFYVENVLLTGLFGLWLWPEMFRGVDGAFANPFQAAPLDLYQENFVANRPGMALLWQLLDDTQYLDHIRQYWREKNGITNHFVNWQFLNEELLELALHAIPASHLKAIFERLLFDIKSNRSGLPDLIQFYPANYYPATHNSTTHNSKTHSYRMIEVKGPGDRIQDNQYRWLDYFATKTIPAEVWYVSWE